MRRKKKRMAKRQRNATSESIANGWAWQSLWEMQRFTCNDDLTAAFWRWVTMGNAVRTFFFNHISHFRCHFLLSFEGNFCFYKHVSFTLQRCQQWNVTKITDESSPLILTQSVGDNEAWQGSSSILRGKNVTHRTKHAQWNPKHYRHLNASRHWKQLSFMLDLHPLKLRIQSIFTQIGWT